MIKFIHLQDLELLLFLVEVILLVQQHSSYLVIAGGGGGFDSSGGGAGGYRSTGNFGPSPLRVSSVTAVQLTDFPITVGAGGAGQPPSPFLLEVIQFFQDLTITSKGGGGGAKEMLQVEVMVQMAVQEDQVVVLRWLLDSSSFTGGSGNTPPVSPPQGNNGAPSALGKWTLVVLLKQVIMLKVGEQVIAGGWWRWCTYFNKWFHQQIWWRNWCTNRINRIGGTGG